MESRPKRTINKPTRYETMESDEPPKKKKMAPNATKNVLPFKKEVRQLQNILIKNIPDFNIQQTVHGSQSFLSNGFDTNTERYNLQPLQYHLTGYTQPIISNITSSHVDNGGPSWVTQNSVQPSHGGSVGPTKRDIQPAITDNGRVTAGDLESRHMESQHMESQHMASQHMKSQHMASQHMASQHMESQHMESPHLESRHLESRHMESQHIESQRMESPHLESRHLESRHMESQNMESQRMESPHLESRHLESRHMESRHMESQRSDHEESRHCDCAQPGQVERLEAELRRMRTVIDNVYKCVKQQYNAPQKPPCIPISSVAEMHAFEKVDESTYSDVAILSPEFQISHLVWTMVDHRGLRKTPYSHHMVYPSDHQNGR